MNEKYPLFIKWRKITDWVLDTVEKFPKSVRFTISSKIAEMTLTVVELIIEAIYAKDKRHILEKINLYMEKLRVFFRICYERKYISISQFEYICVEIDEAGKMTGGWLKSLKKE